VKRLRKLLAGFGKLLLNLGKRLHAGLSKLLFSLGKPLLGLSNWVVFLAAMGALIVGVWLLWDDLHGGPAAEAFTRVGGPTRVETAVDASWFWLTPPQCVVTARADRRQQIMFRAAQFAMAHDAPLLFTSRNPKRQRRVDIMVGDWQTLPLISRNPEWVPVGPTTDRSQPEATVPPPCRGKGYAADASRVSTLAASNQLFMHPLPVRVRNTLAPIVVFAAVEAPGDSPDVAVGLALAAHMAMKYPAVSLVVVPRYLQSDPQLEDQLRNQHELVQGGVVLGSTRILSDDTRALLRQLLTATDRLGVLGQIQTNLGAVGPFVAALLALLGGVAAVQAGKEVLPQAARAFEAAPGIALKAIQAVPGIPGKITKAVPEIRGKTADEAKRLLRIILMAESDWTKALKDKLGQEVTVTLRSGRTITGKVDGQYFTATVFRLNEAKFDRPGEGHRVDQAATTKLSVLVAVQDIESITVVV
jgi:hypothetical protein